MFPQIQGPSSASEEDSVAAPQTTTSIAVAVVLEEVEGLSPPPDVKKTEYQQVGPHLCDVHVMVGQTLTRCARHTCLSTKRHVFLTHFHAFSNLRTKKPYWISKSRCRVGWEKRTFIYSALSCPHVSVQLLFYSLSSTALLFSMELLVQENVARRGSSEYSCCNSRCECERLSYAFYHGRLFLLFELLKFLLHTHHRQSRGETWKGHSDHTGPSMLRIDACFEHFLYYCHFWRMRC